MVAVENGLACYCDLSIASFTVGGDLIVMLGGEKEIEIEQWRLCVVEYPALLRSCGVLCTMH